MLQEEPGRFGANNNFDFSLFKVIVLYHTFMILNGAFVSFFKTHKLQSPLFMQYIVKNDFFCALQKKKT